MRPVVIEVQQRYAFPTLILTILIWGYNWVPVKIGLDYSSPMELSAMRVAGGACVLFVLLALMRRPLGPPRDLTFLLLGLFQTAGNMGFSTLAIAYGDISRASILLFTMPLWAMIIARIWLAERIGMRRWIAGLIAGVGMGIVVADAAASHRTLIGALFALCAGASWAIGVVIARRVLVSGQDVLSTVAWQQLAGSVPIVLLAFAVHEQPVAWTGTFLVALVFSAVIGSGLSWYLWGLSVSAIPASTVALWTLAIPIVASLSAFVQLGERPDVRQLIGFMFILGALAFAMIGSARSRERPRRLEARAF